MKIRKSTLKDLSLCVVVSTLIIGAVTAMFYFGMSLNFFVRWIGLAIMTALLFGVVLEDSGRLLRKGKFWFSFTSFLIVHCTAWAIILIHAKTWKFIWFYPMIIEVPLLSSIKRYLRQRMHKGVPPPSIVR